MNKLYKYVIIAISFFSVSCIHSPLSDQCYVGTEIEVIVDWHKSGITLGNDRESDYVHRVSLRFFPKDGSAPFDRYLEENIFNGVIKLPVGTYSVVAFNEAIDDPYWTDALTFTQTDSFTQFAANISNVTPDGYVFYPIIPNQNFVREPLKLASWSLDLLEITPNMLPSNNPNAMINALKKVVMRKLFVNVRVVAEVMNLSSAMRIEGALIGFSDKVYMASGLTNQASTTHLFAFTAPMWNDSQMIDGHVERNFYSFGAQPQAASYSLWLGIIFVNGERYHPDNPLQYDVTQQVEESLKSNIEIRIKFPLPKVNSDIDIGHWDDKEITIQ